METRTTQPPKRYDFSLYVNKYIAREEMIGEYRELTGMKSIPESKQYWTLCAEQSSSKKSEINQMISSGMISISQFYGVDRDPIVIKKNRKTHPKAHWYCGNWENVIKREKFNPAFIYLDTMNTGKNAAEITAVTMRWAPPGTILFVNVITKTPHVDIWYDPNELIEGLKNKLSIRCIDRWEDPRGMHFKYTATKRTNMATFVFRAK